MRKRPKSHRKAKQRLKSLSVALRRLVSMVVKLLTSLET